MSLPPALNPRPGLRAVCSRKVINLKRYGYQKKNIFRHAPIPRPVISRSKHSAGPTSYSGRRSGGHLAKLILNRHCNFPILNDHILR